LGKIQDVPIKFGEATISVDVIVTNATNYDILIGNQWLYKAKAIIDLSAQKMQIVYQGRKIRISINVHKEVCSEIKEEQEKEVYMVTTRKGKSKQLIDEE
jgi:hypothetical protein